MLKALWFLIRLGLVVAAIVWVAERPGDISIHWLGYHIETSVGFALICLVCVMIITALLYRGWRAFVTVPKVFRRYQTSQKHEKGYQAVTRGLVAVAAGDGREASKQARRARGLLPGRSLTRLLSAQSYLMAGDDAAARVEFKGLLDDKDAAFFGLRGLLNDARRYGRREEAVRLMRYAEKLQPRRGWILKMLFESEAQAKDWDKAEQTLSKAIKTGAIARDTGQRHRLAILLARSMESEAKGILHAALSFAKKAFKADPSFYPAALRLARLLHYTNKRRAAVRVIEQAWAVAPHPELAVLWEDLMPPQKKPAGSALQKFDWVKRLAACNPDHINSKYILGSAALDAKLWGEARIHLKAARAYRLLARLEQQEHNDDKKAREWLELAADAPPDAVWICDICADIPPSWTPLCRSCQGFDSLSWRVAHQAHLRPVNVDTLDYELIEPPQDAKQG